MLIIYQIYKKSVLGVNSFARRPLPVPRKGLNETAKREFALLLAIKDQYPKYVITMDDFWEDDIEGVQHIYIADFLLQNQ